MIDSKIEQVTEDEVFIHRRILTPWFQIRLKPLKVKFITRETISIAIPFPVCIYIPTPPGMKMVMGFWKDAPNRYLPSLSKIRPEYSKLVRGK